MLAPLKHFRIRSYVGRGLRNAKQAAIHDQLFPLFGLSTRDGKIDFPDVFKRTAPTCLEIGFGSGFSLLKAAQLYPEINFIGVETHAPGVGQLYQAIDRTKVTNIRIYQADVVDVLHCLPDSSLASVHIFFPDPWPKRRHQQRRLVQTKFVVSLQQKLQSNGELHMATDWADYAEQMMAVCSAIPTLTNCVGEKTFAPRSPMRPIVTKFEGRAIRAGRTIYDLHFRFQPQTVGT